MEQVLTILLESKSKSTTRKTLIHNHCDCIEETFNNADTDIPTLLYKTPTKELEYLSIGHYNLIQIIISYFQYQIHDNDTIGNDWAKFTKENFNEFRIK